MLESTAAALAAPDRLHPHDGGHVVPWPSRLTRVGSSSEGLVFRLPSRSQLYSQSEAVASTFEILQGSVMLTRLMQDGRRQIVDILGPGRLFGSAMSSFQQVAAETLTASELKVTTCEGDVAPSRVNAELRLALSRLQAHAVLLGRKSALERVASGLVELGQLLAEPLPAREDAVLSFHLPLTRSDLADWLGLVLETVSRNLSQLQRQHLIAIERQEHIHVLDLEGLKRAGAYEGQ